MWLENRFGKVLKVKLLDSEIASVAKVFSPKNYK